MVDRWSELQQLVEEKRKALNLSYAVNTWHSETQETMVRGIVLSDQTSLKCTENWGFGSVFEKSQFIYIIIIVETSIVFESSEPRA